eukprot:TRINITY_DN2261_c0_g1_i2.p1 TRINITY_DN2261_c0_g1~~TRINITY_DN2261_c0_g1_i2.p1  ORF type:complete len:496 (-),score=119.42 TRINITY_DN2261_c0_g1_i2:118-1605(-)
MLSVLLSVIAAVLLALVAHKLFFTKDDSNIKETAPFWLLPYRFIWQKKSTAEVAKELAKTYGPICYLWFGLDKRVLVNDVDLSRTVFSRHEDYPKHLTLSPASGVGKFFGVHVAVANGEEWKKQRKVMNPAFRIQMLKSFTEGFVEKIQIFLDILDKRLHEAESKNEQFVFEPNDLLQKMTLDVLGRAVFDYDFKYMNSDKEDEFITSYNSVLHKLLTPKFILFPWLASSGLFGAQEEMNKFDKFLFEVIERRRKSMAEHPDIEPKDLLGLMLKSVDDAVLTDRQLRDNVFVFFLAGHETTAGTLASALYSMAKNPREQVKLLEDSKIVKGNAPTYEQTQKLEYIPLFIREVMRLYSSVTMSPTRETLKEERLGDFTIKKNTRVIVNVAGIHHSPSCWKDPDQFNPTRFLHKSMESETEDMTTAWMAFGGGPRACLGNNFSLLEQKLFLAMFVQRFEVLEYPGYEYKEPVIGLQKPLDLKVIIKRRASNAPVNAS